jgi:hypothetical protein
MTQREVRESTGQPARRRSSGALPTFLPPGDRYRVGVVATIESVTLSVDPGAETACEVRVRNTGQVVDRVLLDVVGDAADWSTVEPPQLNLLPGTDGTARVLFHPPRSSEVLAGDVDFAVRARSQEDPDGSVVEEGTVTVTPFTELIAELTPRTARGRRASKFRLVVSNLGNAPIAAEVSALDPDELLVFTLQPEAVLARPGTATFVKLRAAPKKRFVKGPDKSLPFQAFVLPEVAEPVTVDGAMLQQQMMPRWLLPAIAVVVAGVAVLVALWFLVLKPTVVSSAQDAVAQQTTQLANSASAANQAATQANQAASKANTAAGGGGAAAGSAAGGSGAAGAAGGSGSAGAGGSGGASGGGVPAGGTPVSALLQSNAAPTKTGSFATYPYTFPAGQTILNVSDLVLQNPMGDSGILQVRAGDTALLEFGLDNFRNLDLHYVQQLVFTTKAPLVIAVECLNPTATNCTAAVSFSGSTQK